MAEAKPESGTSLFLNVQKGISDRMNDPIISTFSVSFILCNWKFFLFIFLSKDEIGVRIDNAIDNYILGNYLITSLLIPIVFTYVYLFQWPKIINKILYKIEKYKVEREDNIKKAQGESLISEKESMDYKNKVELYEKLIIEKYIELYPSMRKENFEFLNSVSNYEAPFFAVKRLDEMRNVSTIESPKSEDLKNLFIILKKKKNVHFVYKAESGKLILPKKLINEILINNSPLDREEKNDEYIFSHK